MSCNDCSDCFDTQFPSAIIQVTRGDFVRFAPSVLTKFSRVSMVTYVLSELITELLGSTNSEIVESCLYYCALAYSDNKWVRRKVETTCFESEITLKRHFTFDVDFDAVNSLRNDYSRSDTKCYLPAIQGLRRAPLLDIDVSGSIATYTARRRENATLGAAVLVGHILQNLDNEHGDLESEVWISWVRPFVAWLASLERDIDTNATSIPKTIDELDELLPNYLPLDVRTNLLQSFEVLQSYWKSYTLYLIVPCRSSEGNAATKAACTGVAQFKVTRPDSIEHDRPSGAHRRISGRLLHFLFMGTEYMVNLPQFGSGDGGHARLVCPKGLTIDSVDIFQGNRYFQLHRQPQGSNTSKYWSLHYGYSNNTKDNQDNPEEQGVALEVLYNRKRIELHDRGLPPVPPETDGNDVSIDPGVWQVRMSISSRRSRFLGPTLGLLICSIYALVINAGSEANFSSVSTLSLPILLGFLIVGEEHLVLSRTLAKVRWIVGFSTASFVIAACTLAARVAKHTETNGFLPKVSLAFAVLLGIASVITVLGHIIRIQLFRTNVFEELRFRASKVYHDHTDKKYDSKVVEMRDCIARLERLQKTSVSTRQERRVRNSEIRNLKICIKDLKVECRYIVHRARLDTWKDAEVSALRRRAYRQMLFP